MLQPHAPFGRSAMPSITFVASVVLILLTGFADAATLKVDKDDCSQSDTYCGVQSAIDAAGEGDTVLLMVGDYDLWQESLSIRKSITLQGAGADSTRLLGEGKAPTALLNISAGVASVTLQGLTVQDRIVAGTAAMGAAALEHQGDDLSLIDVAFINNRGGWGGAVRLRTLFGQVTVENCLFEKNTGFAGGALASYDGSALELNIKDSVFRDNNAVFSGGGLLMRDAAEVTLDNVLIENNTAGNTGGGVHFFTDTGESQVTIIGSTIRANQASNTGGVSTRGDAVAVTIESSTVRNNTSFDHLHIADCGGGGISLSGGNNDVEKARCEL